MKKQSPSKKPSGRDLEKISFDYIAGRLGKFLEDQNLMGQTLPLGFSFSFPCKQEAIDKCFLIRWTKDFSCSGVEGKDVVELLKEAIHKRGDFNIGQVAVVNDTVSTMLSCSYQDPNCEIGLIIGTGTNACYMEEVKNVEHVEGEEGRMCINTEWGGFGDDGSLKDIQTECDKMVDEKSDSPGVHIFEKMISGLYLGEIVRLVLIKLTEKNLLFKGQTSTELEKKNSFKTEFISAIEQLNKGLENTKKILTDLKLEFQMVDVHVVRLVCKTVSTRSAHLCAAATAAVAERIRENRGLDQLKIMVGVDGTVYKKHPNFSTEFQEKLSILAPKCDFTFLDSDGSSGTGAAKAVAVDQRLQSGR
ncbi:hexokinase-2-like [Anabas testudineus]|uniref:hexokinase-2-like n=1 Tax=Anabas testudineus TaxID=64144 RepID=UPI000E45D7AB|nr:hexokinase-2-like [Anabas testudineus]